MRSFRRLFSFLIASWLLVSIGCQPANNRINLATPMEDTANPNVEAPVFPTTLATTSILTATPKPVATPTMTDTPVLSEVKESPSPTMLSENIASADIEPLPTPSEIMNEPSSNTETDQIIDAGRLFLARYGFYGWLNIIAEESPKGLVFEAFRDYDSDQAQTLFDGPGQSVYLVFSHYSNQVAYWAAKIKGELWIADLTYKVPQKLLADRDESYVSKDERLAPWTGIQISWSPDDLHLFLYSHHEPELSRVYHLETEQFEEWYWYCSDIILSSRTGRLATLCHKLDGVTVESAAYAIVEWGGDIWFSNSSPGEVFLEATTDGKTIWEWSPDGNLVAYFDPNDPEGHLHIADKEGELQKYLPGVSLFQQSEILDDQQQYHHIGEKPAFIWASNAPVLLFQGFGASTQPCPPLISDVGELTRRFNWHCWQAFDVDKGEIIWSETTLASSLGIDEGSNVPISMGIDTIAISGDGRAIATYTTYNYPQSQVVLVDIQTGLATTVSTFEHFQQIFWGD